MARINRGGSVLGFSITTLVVAGLLVGGAYTLRQLTTQQTAVAQNEPQPQAKPSADQPKSDSTSNQKSNPPQDNSTSTPSSSSSASTTAGELPQTGPGSLLGTVAALGLLSATAVAYARSRRPELSL